MIVLDNSVVVDVLLARVPRERIGDGPFAAPDLIDAEFVQVLRRLDRGGLFADGQAEQLLGRFAALRIDRHSMRPLQGRAFALRHNLSAYDAMYVALAESLDTALYTSDARIARASGIRCPVEVV